MKKSMLLLLAAFSMGTVVAQNTNPATSPSTTQPQNSKTQSSTWQNTPAQQNTKVPGTVNQRFSTDYPDMKPNWSASGTNYRAEYTDTDSKLGRAVLYDQNGNPVGKELELSPTEYPKTITEYYTATYPNEEYRVWSTEDMTGKRNYFVTRKSEVIWFDDKGVYKTKTLRTTEVKNPRDADQ